METTLMKRLARRQHLAKRFGVEYVDGLWPHLIVESPVGVARIVGEAKRQVKPSGRVFVRGQISHYDEMRASLFRASSADPICLRSAEEELMIEIGQRIPVARFQSDTLGAVLQHYGFRTTWLDAVDNLFVALWFAGHDLSIEDGGLLKVRASGKTFGWLFLLEPPEGVCVVDLRSEHHPLSARPHVQHGVSIATATAGSPDLREFVVATLRIPVAGLTGGSLFAGSFLFPPVSADHTLRLLLRHRVDELAASIERKHGLASGALGRTMRMADAT